jgi:membrane protease YdiL (CAAX protease family)
MAIESALFAVSLWGVSAALGRVLDVVPLPLSTGSEPHPAMQHLVSFLGAGIYEEVLFRLLLMSLLLHLFQLGDLTPLTATSLAVVISALVFAAAHHDGAAGEPFQGHIFLFRTVAGVYFALLMQWRGFGVAVGAHAAYDVLVGVVLPCA